MGGDLGRAAIVFGFELWIALSARLLGIGFVQRMLSDSHPTRLRPRRGSGVAAALSVLARVLPFLALIVAMGLILMTALGGVGHWSRLLNCNAVSTGQPPYVPSRQE